MVKSVFFFANGNTAVCDAKGAQMPELQESWLLHFLRFIEEHTGQQPDAIAEIRLPDGRCAKPFRIAHGWNWEIS